MKKAFDQTLRDIKRGVNKKVLKVPYIEQKVLDATTNEPWGPHGSLLAEIAEATRKYPHEYQIIMSVLWKRINDTGKNWRHVYKALTVFEYLSAHGSERVVDEIKEHAYQLSTLSDFQYVDSKGNDQGNNVRKKSQSLVILVNDKYRVQEIRQKATTNREKYRSTSMGGMYKSGSFSSSGGYSDRYDDDRYGGRYGNRDDDRNGYGHDDSYSRYGDSYGRGRQGRGMYRDDDYRGRDESVDGYQYGSRSRRDDDYRGRDESVDGYQYSSRSRSAGRNWDRACEDDSRYSLSTMGTRLERKYSEQNLDLPPSSEELAARSSTYGERDEESSLASASKALSPPAGARPSHATAAQTPHSASASLPDPASARAATQDRKNEVDGFHEFDPQAAPTTSNGTAPASSGDTGMDSIGSLQPFDDPFGDGPFKAIPSTDSVAAQQQITTVTGYFNTNSSESFNVPQAQIVPRKAAIEFGDTPTNTQFVQKELSTLHQDVDILADILPPSSSSSSSSVSIQSSYQVPAGQSAYNTGVPSHTYQPTSQQNSFVAQTGQRAGFPTQPGQPLQPNYVVQSAESVSQSSFLPQSLGLTFPIQASPASHMGFHSQSRQRTSFAGFQSKMGSTQAGVQASPGGQSVQPNPSNPNFYGASQSLSTIPPATNRVPPSFSGPVMQHNVLPQSGPAVTVASQLGLQAAEVRTSSSMAPASTGSSGTVQPSKDTFETKSTVWADTLSRGLVNLNISGPKTNPLADIGVDFDAINRKERRMEKPTTTVISTVTMGKAMGSGSGIGRASAGALKPPSNPMIGPGAGMGMGGYGVGMGMGQGFHMQQQNGYPPGSKAHGTYNPLTGTGNYGQQPYDGGYR